MRRRVERRLLPGELYTVHPASEVYSGPDYYDCFMLGLPRNDVVLVLTSPRPDEVCTRRGVYVLTTAGHVGWMFVTDIDQLVSPVQTRGRRDTVRL